MGIESRLHELGIELPPPPSPVASYVPVAVSGNFAFVAGQVPTEEGSPLYPGHVGAEVGVDQAQEAARRCALQALSALRAELGTLDRVRRIVHVAVFVASAPGFTDQSKVANAASEVLVEVFGDAGRHARVAVGVAELPLNVPVEVAVTAEIETG